MRPQWLSRDALAAHLDCSIAHVDKMRRGGRLPTPSFHLGRSMPRWNRAEVDAMMAAGGARHLPVTDIDEAIAGFQDVYAKARQKASG